MAQVFRVTNDHLKQYDYVCKNQLVQTLIGGNGDFESARKRISDGEAAFFWMNQKCSPFPGDGRAIFALGVIEDVTPRRLDWAREQTKLFLTDSPDAIHKLREKENDPHATIRVLRVLDETELLMRESLIHDPDLLSAIELPSIPTARTLDEDYATRLDELIALLRT